MIAEFAAAQHSMVARRQLLAMEFSADVIDRRLASRRLRLVLRGVYSVTPKITQRGWWMAAVLAAGPGAVLSHRAAAALYGVAKLRTIVSDRAFTKVTRSELEDQFLETLARNGIEPPVTNTMIQDHECDAVWPRHRLVVELDSRTFHSDATAFENDRRRDRILQRAGWRVVRITKRQLDREEAAVVGDLRALLSASGGRRAAIHPADAGPTRGHSAERPLRQRI